jgi:membrane protein implicated in regulation of membrane protease activity
MKPIWKMALFSGVSAVAAMLLRRRMRRRAAAVDVGTVSDEWLAQRRGVNDAL